MRDYTIFTDSTCDLSPEMYAENGLEVFTMYLAASLNDSVRILKMASRNDTFFVDYGKRTTGSPARAPLPRPAVLEAPLSPHSSRGTSGPY